MCYLEWLWYQHLPIVTISISIYIYIIFYFFFLGVLEVCFSYIYELFDSFMHWSLIIFTSLAQFLPDSAPISYPLFFSLFSPLNSNCVAHILVYVWSPTWNMSNLPGSTLSGRTNFPSPGTYHLLIASQLGVGLCVHFHLSMMGFCLIWFFCLLLLFVVFSSWIFAC